MEITHGPDTEGSGPESSPRQGQGYFGKGGLQGGGMQLSFIRLLCGVVASRDPGTCLSRHWLIIHKKGLSVIWVANILIFYHAKKAMARNPFKTLRIKQLFP
jgi:hypothetical protein